MLIPGPVGTPEHLEHLPREAQAPGLELVAWGCPLADLAGQAVYRIRDPSGPGCIASDMPPGLGSAEFVTLPANFAGPGGASSESFESFT